MWVRNKSKTTNNVGSFSERECKPADLTHIPINTKRNVLLNTEKKILAHTDILAEVNIPVLREKRESQELSPRHDVLERERLSAERLSKRYLRKIVPKHQKREESPLSLCQISRPCFKFAVMSHCQKSPRVNNT